MDVEMAAAMREQLARFRQKFGRDPGPDDPVFFDPEKDTPTPIDADAVDREIIQAMVRAGIRPEIIYAYKKTGLILTEANEDKVLPEDRVAWDQAIEEYFRLTGDKQ
jgi:hypothetical protein